MKIIVIVPDGVGIRNFLFSSLLSKIEKIENEIVLWNAIGKAIDKNSSFEEIRRIKFPQYKESARAKFFRETASLMRLKHNVRITGNETIESNWNPSKRHLPHKLFYAAVESTASVLNGYGAILSAERAAERAVESSEAFERCLAFLRQERPDVLFNTHQRAVSAVPAVAAAKKLGIRTVTAIYSWDNLPKARLATRTDEYVVWSEYMRWEMGRYYPEIAFDRIHVTGTPQFEFYRDASLYESKEAFCARYGLDPERPIVCFSGDDRLTSPYDPEYLRDLAEAVASAESNKRPQILFRRCPADFSDRYDAVLKKYADIVRIADPLWKREEGGHWTQYCPTFEDVKLLVNIARHCDTVYNVASTMALDFAMFDKASCYIAYDQPQARDWSVKTVYAFEHFKTMAGLDAVVMIRNKEEILSKVTEAIEEPDRAAPDRRKWLEIVTGGAEIEASENIANVLLRGKR